jgi:hypothetical protein
MRTCCFSHVPCDSRLDSRPQELRNYSSCLGPTGTYVEILAYISRRVSGITFIRYAQNR